MPWSKSKSAVVKRMAGNYQSTCIKMRKTDVHHILEKNDALIAICLVNFAPQSRKSESWQIFGIRPRGERTIKNKDNFHQMTPRHLDSIQTVFAKRRKVRCKKTCGMKTSFIPVQGLLGMTLIPARWNEFCHWPREEKENVKPFCHEKPFKCD